MAVIGLKAFGGMQPFVQPRLLPESGAQSAVDVLLDSGAIRPMAGTTTLKALTSANPRTIYRYRPQATADTTPENQFWLEFPGDVDVARSPVVDDSFDRLYWTDGTQPRYAVDTQLTVGSTLPGSSFFLGIPRPANTPMVAAGGGTVVTMVEREYVVTLTSASAESAPGPVITVTTADGLSVRLNDLPTANQGNAAVTGKRLYRKVAGTYRRVASLGILDSFYTDTATDASLGGAATLPLTVAVAAPTAAVVATAAVPGAGSAPVAYQYVYTRAGVTTGTDYISETPPSPPVTATANDSQLVNLSNILNLGGVNVEFFKIYRRRVGQAQYGLIAQVPRSQTTYTDLPGQEIAGEPLSFDPSGGADSLKPTTAMTASVTGSAGGLGAVSRRAYLILYEDAAGNLSAPAPVSNTVDAIDDVTLVNLSHPETPPPGVLNKRVYRQNLAVSGATVTANPSNWRLLVTLPAGSTSAVDLVPDTSLGATLALSAVQRIAIPSYTATAQATVPSPGISEARVYVYTYVSAYGEEGPPSAPSALVTAMEGQNVTVSGMSATPGGNYNIALKRIYRSLTSTSGNAEFQFVAELPVANGSFVDNVEGVALGEVLPSETWLPPPPTLRGLRVTANGWAVGFDGKDVFASEPFLPHAWPVGNSVSVAARIIGIATALQNVYVMTDTFPFVVTGVDPSALSTERLPIPQACVSKRSIVETGDGVLYASPDGVIGLGSRVANLTETILNRAQWQAYNPQSMHAYYHERRYFVFYTTTGGVRGLLIFDFSGTAPIMTTGTLGAASEIFSGHHDAQTDTLYLASGGNILRLNASTTPMTGTWRSKIWRLPRPVIMAAVSIKASDYPVTFALYGDGTLRSTTVVTSENPQRLPSGFMCQEWFFEVTGTAQVFEVQAASSVGELREV